MAQNEHAARCFSFFATEAFPTREILLGVWRLNVLATTSGLLLEVNVDAGEFPIALLLQVFQLENDSVWLVG